VRANFDYEIWNLRSRGWGIPTYVDGKSQGFGGLPPRKIIIMLKLWDGILDTFTIIPKQFLTVLRTYKTIVQLVWLTVLLEYFEHTLYCPVKIGTQAPLSAI